MAGLEWLVFGRVVFETREEYLAFQYRFLCVVILAGAVLTGLLVAGSHAAVNPIAAAHVMSMQAFTLGSVGCWLALRGRKGWFLPVAWGYEGLCMLEYVSALYYVSEDEFRVVWFLTNIPGVYLLLGRRAGLLISLATACGLGLGNGWLPAPYSPNALATLISSVVYLGLFFHVYAARSLSYFMRMQESNRQLYEMAMHDPLTGVLNARAYYQHCDSLLHQAARSGAPYAVLFIDLDHFKRVNDTHGHAAGDLVLKAAARCIEGRLRASDRLGRVGGEEFSVFLPDTGLAPALQVAEQIRQALEALEIAAGPGLSLHITASIGVAGPQAGLPSFAELQEQADCAMYTAKKSGRNRVTGFGEQS